MSLGNRIKLIRGDLSQKEFSKLLNVSITSFQKYEYDDRVPDADFILKICNKFKVNPTWLLTDKGPMRQEETMAASPVSAPQPLPAALDPEINIHELLNMTAMVLSSDTVYKIALAANIRAFKGAIDTQQENRELRRHIAQLENDIKRDRAEWELRMKALEVRLAAQESAARAAPDDREGKDYELKKTATG